MAFAAKNGRLRSKHRSTYTSWHLVAYGCEFLAYYLPVEIDVGTPIKLYPHYGEAISRLRAHSTHTCTAIYRGLYREGYELLHLLGCHTTGFGHYHYGRRIEVGKHVDIGLAGGV